MVLLFIILLQCTIKVVHYNRGIQSLEIKWNQNIK